MISCWILMTLWPNVKFNAQFNTGFLVRCLFVVVVLLIRQQEAGCCWCLSYTSEAPLFGCDSMSLGPAPELSGLAVTLLSGHATASSQEQSGVLKPGPEARCQALLSSNKQCQAPGFMSEVWHCLCVNISVDVSESEVKETCCSFGPRCKNQSLVKYMTWHITACE